MLLVLQGRDAPLYCAPGEESFDMNVEALRYIAAKSASLHSNWLKPIPTIRRLSSFEVGPKEEIIHIIPGYNLLFTGSTSLRGALAITCWNLLDGQAECMPIEMGNYYHAFSSSNLHFSEDGKCCSFVSLLFPVDYIEDDNA